MRRTMTSALVLAAIACTFAADIARADHHEKSATKQMAAASINDDILFWIEDAEKKLGQLADAMPADKYTWRPAEGVRSPAEVFLHVAAANYGIPASWGVAPPEGFSFQGYEQSVSSKEDVKKALMASFAHMKAALKKATDADMAKQVNLFGQLDTSVRGGYLLMLSHAHEHLGQSIAYARMNGVVPPWSAKQEEGKGDGN